LYLFDQCLASKRDREEELERDAEELRSELKKIRINDIEEIMDAEEGEYHGKMRRSYTTPQRAKAINLTNAWGLKKTAKRTNISENNLKRWRRMGPSERKALDAKFFSPRSRENF
jgi:hypothetical protein